MAQGLIPIALVSGLGFLAQIAAAADSRFAPPVSPWVFTTEISAGAGYKDNLLLSDVNREHSYVIRTTLDAGVSRLPLDGPQFNFFLNGEDTRYPDGRGIHKEQTLVAIAQIKASFAEDFHVNLNAQYLYLDEVFDASITETNLTTLLARGHQFASTPELRWDFAANTSVQLEFLVQRQVFTSDDLDDYWETGPKLTLDFKYHPKSDLAFSIWFHDRRYDHRRQFTAAGVGVPDTHLRYHMQGFEVENNHYWDERRRWRSRTRLQFERNEDNGSGYFSYKRSQLREQLRYRSADWEISIEGRVSYYNFDLQTAAPLFTNRRHRIGSDIDIQVTRHLSKQWRVFLEFGREQSISNQKLDEYTANKVLAGVGWEY